MKNTQVTATWFALRGAKSFIIFFVLFATSCTTYKKCQQKYQNTFTTIDSVRVTAPVIVTVPRDSVVTSFVTDTTYLYKEIQQGRAKVIVERTNTITTVQARCDTVTIIKTVRANVPVKWGVAPKYKSWFYYALVALAVSVFFNLTKFHKNEY